VVWLINIPHFGTAAFGSTWKGALHYMKIAVALGVAAIPEGLPAVITLCLSLGTTRMAKQQVIVRKLPSVETLGCTTVICTDKTGTLTTGQMTVTALLTFTAAKGSSIGIDLQERHVEGVSYIPVGQVHDVSSLGNTSLVRDIILISSLCNEAKIIFNQADQRYDRIGEPTEAAFKVFAEKLGTHLHPLPAQHTAADAASYVSDLMDSKYQRLAQLEFHRDRKSMGMMMLGSDRHQLLVKGAAEMVVMRCNRIKLRDGSIIPISKSMREYLLDQISQVAARPLRCLAMAYKDMQEYSSNSRLQSLAGLVDSATASNNELLKDRQSFMTIEDDMVLVAFCGIKDPARPEVKPAISSCRDAGIRVMMITGDSKETAVSIAKDVGIFDGTEDLSQCAFTGQEFFQKPLERQYQLLRSNNKVFCRTEPQDKQRLVSILQDVFDEVVAMTGDGVNDAPALSQAAIGVAMGITGTDAAKSAADMILADDNFASIVRAVEEGRNIFYNMQTFCCFLISSNIGEVILMAVAAALGFPEPLLPMHLLWINLVTDGPPATALGFNPSDPRAMQQPPRSKHESLLSRWMLTRYVLTGAYVGFAAMSCYYSWFQRLGLTWMQLRSWTSCDDWNSIFLPDTNRLKIDCSLFSHPHQLLQPQSMALASLVCMEMLKALSAVSLDQSLLIVPPWRNPWLLLAVTLPTMLHLLVMYLPPLSRIFHIVPLSWPEWKVS
jgi:P-type Ca2+ transporter type 2C